MLVLVVRDTVQYLPENRIQVGLNPKSPILGQAVYKPFSKFEGNFHRNNRHRNAYFYHCSVKMLSLQNGGFERHFWLVPISCGKEFHAVKSSLLHEEQIQYGGFRREREQQKDMIGARVRILCSLFLFLEKLPTSLFIIMEIQYFLGNLV